MKRFLPLIRAFSGRFLSAAGVIALSIILSRQLSLTEAGLFFEAFITLMGLAIAVQVGIPLVILRKVARLRDDLQETDAILARGLSSICAISSIVAALWIGFFFATKGFNAPISWVWANILPVAAMGPVSSYLKASGYPGRGGFWEVGIVSLIASGVVLITPPTEAMTAWIMFSGACWAGMIAAIALAGARHFRSFLRPVPDIPLLLEGRFLWMTSVMAYISLWGGVLIATWLLEAESTAQLNALFRTLTPLQFLIMTIDFYMAPKFANASGIALRSLYRKARLLCALMALPYVVITTAFPGKFLVLLYGESYEGLGFELRLIIIAIFAQIMIGPSGILLNMKSDDKIMLQVIALKTVIYFILSVVLTVNFGVVGIMVALSVSTVFQAILQYIAVSKKYLRRKHETSV